MTIPEELLPVLEWWERDGKKTLAIAAAVGVVVLAWQGVKGYRESRLIASGDAEVNAETVEELEAAVASYGSTKAGAALKLRLAKAYYDAGSYEDAAALYAKIDAPRGFEELPTLGLAQCLEAKGDYAAALDAYTQFAESNPESPFLLQAKIGAARATALSSGKPKALEMLAALKAGMADDEAALRLVENAEDVVKRWEKREEAASALDAVAEAVKAVEEIPVAEEAPAAAPAPEAPAAEAQEAK